MTKIFIELALLIIIKTIAKITFAPFWLFCVFLDVMFYVYNKITNCEQGHSFKSIIQSAFEYWII